jgi:hypothetical protein
MGRWLDGYIPLSIAVESLVSLCSDGVVRCLDQKHEDLGPAILDQKYSLSDGFYLRLRDRQIQVLIQTI